MVKVKRIDHINLNIPENGVEDALKFYRDILGFEPEKLEKYRKGDRTSFGFKMNETSMIIVRPVKEFRKPDNSSFDHFCILVEDDIDTVKAEMNAKGVNIVRDGTPWGPTGRSPSIYVEDPFGYKIEIKQS